MFSDAQRLELGRPCKPEEDPRVKIDPVSGEPYLPASRVIDSLNAIFGPGMWSSEIRDPQVLFSGQVELFDRKAGKAVPRLLVVAQCTTRIIIRDEEGRQTTHEDVGVAQSYQAPPIPPYELALKSAASDGLKRAARKLGTFLGNSLYDKDDKSGAGFVDLERQVGAPPTADPRQAPPPAASAAPPASRPSPAPPTQQATSQAGGRTFPPKDEANATKAELDTLLSSYYQATGDLPPCAAEAGVYSPDDLAPLSEAQAVALLGKARAAFAALPGRK